MYYCAMVLSSAQWMDMMMGCMNILGVILMNTCIMQFLCWNNTEVRRVICSSSKQRGFSLPFRHSIELRARFCSMLLHPAVSFHTLEQPIARSPHVHFVMEGGATYENWCRETWWIKTIAHDLYYHAGGCFWWHHSNWSVFWWQRSKKPGFRWEVTSNESLLLG